jgi:hypothetical protein
MREKQNMNNFDLTVLRDITIDIKFKENKPYTNYTLTHGLRWAHDRMKFGMTDNLINLLKEYNLFETELVSKSQRQRYNKNLKKFGINDEVMIEHMISVKNLVEGLWELKSSLNDNLEIATYQVREYLEQNTNCIIKLKHLEKELHG